MPSADLLALPAASASSSSSVADFEARLVPSAVEAGVWNCAVRTTPGVGYARFAQLAPGSRLLVDVKGVQGCGDAGAVASEAVASSDLKLVPEFRVIVPPIHLSGSFDSKCIIVLTISGTLYFGMNEQCCLVKALMTKTFTINIHKIWAFRRHQSRLRFHFFHLSANKRGRPIWYESSSKANALKCHLWTSDD